MAIEVTPTPPAELCTGGTCLSYIIENFGSPALASDVRSRIQGAVQNLRDAGDAFRDRLLLEASDLLFKIGEVQKFLDLADCFNLLTQFQTGSERILNPFAQFDPALQKGLAERDKLSAALDTAVEGINFVANSANLVVDQVEAVLSAVDASGLVGPLAEAYSHIQKYVDQYQEKAEDVQTAISIYDKAVETASCLGIDPSDSKIIDELFKLNETLGEFSDTLDDINDRINFIENFLGGNGCINLTC